jgi:hypothetical protein
MVKRPCMGRRPPRLRPLGGRLAIPQVQKVLKPGAVGNTRWNSTAGPTLRPSGKPIGRPFYRPVKNGLGPAQLTDSSQLSISRSA